MAATFRLRLTTAGQSSYKGKLALSITLKGTSQRTYIRINGLNNPDYNNWDEKQGIFVGHDENTEHNNKIANTLYRAVEAIKDNPNLEFHTVQDLKQAYTQGINIQAKKNITFGELVSIIDKEEYDKGTGGTYQVYRNLKNKLYALNGPTYNGVRIADIPAKEICDEHFIAFSDWLHKYPRYGYKNLMAIFHASFQRCRTTCGIRPNNVLTFQWRKETSNTNTEKRSFYDLKKEYNSQITTLTTQEIKRFANFDLSLIAPKQTEYKQLLEIYFDMCLFMYYTLSRPVDVIRLKWKNYKEDEGKLTYRVYKLRNKKKSTIVETGLSKKAIAIIEKYKGRNKHGYIFPLPINETNWDEFTNWIDNGKEYERNWDAKRNHTIGAINQYLKKIQVIEKFNVPKLHLYVFRHSAITHAIRTHGMNPQNVADIAGTSVDKIMKHYLGHSEKVIKSPLGA